LLNISQSAQHDGRVTARKVRSFWSLLAEPLAAAISDVRRHKLSSLHSGYSRQVQVFGEARQWHPSSAWSDENRGVAKTCRAERIADGSRDERGESPLFYLDTDRHRSIVASPSSASSFRSRLPLLRLSCIGALPNSRPSFLIAYRRNWISYYIAKSESSSSTRVTCQFFKVENSVFATP